MYNLAKCAFVTLVLAGMEADVLTESPVDYQGDWQERIIHRARYRFFDVEVEIGSDSPGFLELFQRMYHRFEVDGPPASKGGKTKASSSLFCYILTDAPCWKKPVLVIEDQAYTLETPTLLGGYAYERILKAIMARIRSHFMIHAGGVSWHDEGIVMPAHASYGKTTLVLALVRREFKFLSDEMVALGRSDRRLYPFPRSLRLRPGTLELCGYASKDFSQHRWYDKLILDIEDIQPGAMGVPCPARFLILLHDPRSAANRDQGLGSEKVLRLFTDKYPPALIADLQTIPGIQEVLLLEEGFSPFLCIRAERGVFVIPQIEATCRQHQVVIIDLIRRDVPPPVFNCAPRLEPISVSEAVMALIREFRGGHRSVLLQQDFDGSSPRLFLALAEALEDVRCYKLSVGRLNEMIDLVREGVNA